MSLPREIAVVLTPKAPLKPPLRVSPLMRGARYVLFFSGLIYGYVRDQRLYKIEVVIRAEQAKLRVIRDAERAKIKRKFNYDQTVELFTMLKIDPTIIEKPYDYEE